MLWQLRRDVRSTASHFILFSGVTCPKSDLTISTFWDLERRAWSVHTPKYFLPLALKRASRPFPLEFWRLSNEGRRMRSVTGAAATRKGRKSRIADLIMILSLGSWLV